MNSRGERTATRMVVTILAAALVLIPACTRVESGQPTASSSTVVSTRPTPSSSPAQTTAMASNPQLTAVEPCSLLSKAEVASAGIQSQGRRNDVVGTFGCIWPEPGRSVSVNLDPKRGLADTNVGDATRVESLRVGRHDGRRVEESSGRGYCAYDFAVTEKSSVTVLAIILDKTAEACALAERVAKIVEPRLP